MEIDTGKAITGGILGTAVMTAVGIRVAPLMGIPPMDPAVMPMVGMPLFSGSAAMVAGSLIGHLVYGAVIGAVYGPVAARAPYGDLSTAR